MWHISSQWPKIWHNVHMQSKTQSAQGVKNELNILRLIEQKCSTSLQLLLKGGAEPMRRTRLSEIFIESRHCVVCCMGLMNRLCWYLSRAFHCQVCGSGIYFHLYIWFFFFFMQNSSNECNFYISFCISFIQLWCF